ncbi:MAG: transporter, periplasmic solute-binding protein [Actinomycetia bacterium]|nr:transporter, periplasmic solute-binding protein [Actinomycetes bacterium]
MEPNQPTSDEHQDGFRPTRRELIVKGALGGAALALGGAALSSATWDWSASAWGAELASPPKTKPDKIIVRAWADPWSTNIGDIPGKAFTAKTGIGVEFDTTDFAEMDTKVRQAIKAGQRPPVDVVYTINRSAYTADVQKLTVPLSKSAVPNFDKLLSVGKPINGSRNYVTVYTYTTPLFYRKDKTTIPPGSSWNVIFSDQYRGKLHVPNNFDALLFPLAKMLKLNPAKSDLAPLWKKLAELRPNIKIVGDDTPFISGLTSGEVIVGCALVGDATALQQAGVDVGYVVPKEGAVLTGDAMYVPRNLPKDTTYWAQVFINEVIDAKLQSQWTANVSTVPTNRNATPAAAFANDPAFPFTSAQIKKYAIPEPDDLAARNTDAWQSKYTAAIQS